MCVDIECDAFLIDRKFLMQKIFNYKTHARQIMKFLKIRDIENVVVTTTDHISLIFRVFEISIDDDDTIVTFTRQIYIVKELKTKIFLNNDILNSEQMNINVDKQIVIIESCKDIRVKLNVINVESQVKRVARVSEIIKISIKSISTISFKLRDKDSLFIERDFMFTSTRIERLNQNEDVFSHIIDAHTEIVQVHNINFENVYIFKNTRLRLVQKYEKKECYLVDQKYAHLIANVHKSASRN